jgi:hypothetical protein
VAIHMHDSMVAFSYVGEADETVALGAASGDVGDDLGGVGGGVKLTEVFFEDGVCDIRG